MKVNVAMDDVTITLGNNGVTLTVADNDGKHVAPVRVLQSMHMGERRTTEVKRRRHTPEQIVRKLREADWRRSTRAGVSRCP